MLAFYKKSSIVTYKSSYLSENAVKKQKELDKA